MAKGSRNYVAKNLNKFNQPRVFRDRKKDSKLGYDESELKKDLEDRNDQEIDEQEGQRGGKA